LKHGFNNYSEPSKAYPTTLAEALIWKLGKWKTFMKFTAHYQKTLDEVPKTGVVFYAFARHLAEEKEPILTSMRYEPLGRCVRTIKAKVKQLKNRFFIVKERRKGNGNQTEQEKTTVSVLTFTKIIYCASFQRTTLGKT
jgi:hypothetical protein